VVSNLGAATRAPEDGGHDEDVPDGPSAPPPLGAGRWAAVVAAMALCGLSAAMVTLDVGLTPQVIILLGTVVGLTFATIAVSRFWWVVLSLFVVRASLDALKLGHYKDGSSTLDPGVIVGLVFLGAGTLWAVAQWRSGAWQRISATSKWFVALAMSALLSAVFSSAPLASGRTALKMCAGALMFVVLEQYFRSRPERGRAVLVAAGLSIIVPAIVAFEQLRSPRELEAYLEVSRINGTFVHANPFATFLVIVATVSIAVIPHVRGWAKGLAIFAGTAGSVFAFFTYARGAWAALALGLLLIGIKQDRRIVAALVAGLLAVIVLVPSFTARLSDLDNAPQTGAGDPNSLSWRVSYWAELLPLSAQNPITGIGVDQVLATSKVKLQPHSVFVQSLVETGLVGLTCLIGLCIAMARDLARAMRQAPPGLSRGVAIGASAAALGVFTQMFTENLLTQAAIHWYLAAPVVAAIVWSAQGFSAGAPIERGRSDADDHLDGAETDAEADDGIDGSDDDQLSIAPA